jgi:hypothetical protein
MKVDPATLKVGDEVRMVDAFSMFQISGKTSPSKIGICVGGIDFTEAPECRTWFVRKPKKAKPPTRPDEPPVGSFFRVDRTGFEFWRFASMEDGYGYWQISPRSEEPDWERWDDVTEPGDTITLLELTEKGDKKDGGV